MKKHKINKNELITPAFHSVNVLIISSFFFMFGVSSGIFLELMMSPEKKGGVVQPLLRYLSDLADINAINPFPASLIHNILLLFIIFAAGLSVHLFLLALPVLFYKGFTLGFSSCLILGAMEIKGIPVLLLTVIPQNVIMIPTFLLAASGCINYALLTWTKRRGNIRRAKETISLNSYCVSFIVFAGLTLLGCLTEGLLFAIV